MPITDEQVVRAAPIGLAFVFLVLLNLAGPAFRDYFESADYPGWRMQRTAAAKGVVVSRDSGSVWSTARSVGVEYVAGAKGKVRAEVRVPAAAWERLSIGAAIDLEYLPADPTQARAASSPQ